MTLPEIKAFDSLWPGGYWEGDPLDPLFVSAYGSIDIQNGYADQVEIQRIKGIKAQQIGWLSTLYVTYLTCIRGRVRDKIVLEIGPGRGAWSKVIMHEGAKKLYALDALSEEHNRFRSYVDPEGNLADKVKYFQVSDFSCRLPDGVMIEFLFSFGCFCHITRGGTEEYFRHISRVMKDDAEAFVMISDHEKMAKCLGTPFDPDKIVEYGDPSGVPWSHLGVDWFCDMLEKYDFVILDRDVGSNLRDPIVRFKRSSRKMTRKTMFWMPFIR